MTTDSNRLRRIYSRIPRELLVIERELAFKKALHHRYLTAVESTDLFAEAYIRVCKQRFEMEIDYRRVGAYRPLKIPIELNKPSILVGLWRARQAADGAGMPYEPFIRRVIKFLREKRGYKRIPQPNQLLHPAAICYAMDDWEEYRKVSPVAPDLTEGNYAPSEFRNEPPQIEFIEDVLDQVRKGPNRLFRLQDLVFGKRVLREEDVVAAFGPEFLSERSKNPNPPFEFAPPTRSKYVPSCFGVPGAATEEEPCASCVANIKCRRLADLIKRDMQDRLGSDDPHAERKKAKARERKRRQREREAQEQLAAGVPRRPRGRPRRSGVPSAPVI